MKNLYKKILTGCIAFCMTLSVFSGVVNAQDTDTIVILYENDVHCAVDGYSKLAAMKNELLETHTNVGVVSVGDFVQGGTLGAVSKGEYIVNLMNKVGYDAIALGNHEFDYHLPRLNELNAMSNTKFISCNFQKIGEDKSYFEPYTIVSYGNVDVAYIAITTPETINSSSPAQFKNDKGELIYTFNESKLYDIVQTNINAAETAGADYVIALSHIGYDESGNLADITDVIENTDGFDVVVKRIFEMCMNGRGPSQIANQLKADGVLTPTAYKDRQGIKSPNTVPENPCGWNSSTVVNILECREYTGCTVNFKTYTNSIWDKKQRDTPVEKQAIFEDTHEAIIEKDIFDKVQIIRQQRQRRTKSGITSTFSGLVYCADCGEKLYYGATNNGKREGAFFDCSLHWKHKDKCGTHFIRESVLERMVLKHIQLVMGYILRYRQHFIYVMEQQLQLESAEKLQTSRKQLERNERRIAELKRLFIKIYEDNARGDLSDDRFDMMSQNYEAEQKQLEAEVVALRQEIEVQERQNENIERFIRTADKYVDIEEIDPCMLRELIKAIYVEAPDKSSGKRRQNIHIQYDGIGFIPLEELAKKETA